MMGALDGLVRARIAESWFRGAEIRVERAGGLAVDHAWGHALLDGDCSLPMEEGALFDMASVTKLFTTTAILRLASLGRFSLSTRLGEIPGFLESLGRPEGTACEVGAAFGARGERAASGAAGGGKTKGTKAEDAEPARHATRILAGIDVASLLDHSSGLHYWHPFYTETGLSFAKIIGTILSLHPLVPGTVYSDLNFMILGRLVAFCHGGEGGLRQAMRELVLDPLGLAATGYGPVDPAARGLRGGPVVATEFGNRIEEGMVAAIGASFGGWRTKERAIRGEADDGNCHYYFGGAAGHAGIFSDTRDLCALGRLYLDGGRPGGGAGEAFLDPALVELACRDRGSGRGLGFQFGETYPGGGFGHTGFTGTCLYLNRDEGIVIAILSNRLHVPEPRRINDFFREVCEIIHAS